MKGFSYALLGDTLNFFSVLYRKVGRESEEGSRGGGELKERGQGRKKWEGAEGGSTSLYYPQKKKSWPLFQAFTMDQHLSPHVKLGTISESTKSFLKNKVVRINGHQSWLANFFVMARKAVNFNPTHHARHMRKNHPERSNTNNGNTVTWRQLVRLTWHPTINSLNVRLYALHKPILHFPSRRRALWRQRCHVAAHDASNVVASYIGWTSV